jgi:hypothetical protein
MNSRPRAPAPLHTQLLLLLLQMETMPQQANALPSCKLCMAARNMHTAALPSPVQATPFTQVPRYCEPKQPIRCSPTPALMLMPCTPRPAPS